MQLITLLASTEDAAHSHSIIDALPHLAGMLMVMVTLTVLWGVCAFTAKMVGTFLPDKKSTAPATATAAPAPATAAPAPATAAPAPATAESGIAPEILAVIAAAVASVTDKRPVRIVSIRPTSTSWERAGRQSVLTSHRIR
jgi:Na+-transporting methylmalonyl-CoA/oxaloacetate decarboxylase gamma subunit